jgi:undecaprenyl pyrophosphate synthase
MHSCGYSNKHLTTNLSTNQTWLRTLTVLPAAMQHTAYQNRTVTQPEQCQVLGVEHVSSAKFQGKELRQKVEKKQLTRALGLPPF